MKYHGFPTDPNMVIDVQKLKLSAMEPIYLAYKHKSMDLLIDALAPYVDIDLRNMTDPDFSYLLAIIDRSSYTESTRDYNWHCHADINGQDCDTQNTETLRSVRLIRNPLRPLPSGMRWPVLSTWDPAADIGTQLAQAARWIDTDTDYQTTLKALDYRDLISVVPHMQTYMQTEIRLKCSHCLTSYTVVKDLNPLEFLRTHSPQSVNNMQLNLATVLHVMLDDDTELSKFLYWHASWEHDRNEAEKKKRMEASKHGRR